MKKIIYFAILLLNFTLNAQPPGGGARGGRQNQNQQGQQNRERREFKASDVAGVFFYDIEAVIKKIKVKDNTLKVPVSKALKDYNFKIREVSFLNSEKFDDLNKEVNTLMKSRGINNNLNDEQDNIRKKVREALRPVRIKIDQSEKELNNNLEELLSEKQFKKWLNYQKKKKESLRPEKQQKNQKKGNRQNEGRKRRN